MILGVANGLSRLALGMVGASGLLLALGGFVATSAGRRSGRWLSRRLQPIGWLALVGLGVGMLGGGATIIGFIVGPYLRAWDRIAIAVAFLALAGVGVAATWLGRRFRPSLRAPVLALTLRKSRLDLGDHAVADGHQGFDRGGPHPGVV